MSQETVSPVNAEQLEFWNSAGGEAWAQHQEQLDRLIAPLGLAALGALSVEPGESLIDIGCGCGQTTLDLAVRVGAGGRVLGIDISTPMLEVARRRPPPESGARPEFQLLDAQSGNLGRSVFDAAFSRFGVMFFSDPVAAFANIRESLKPNGRLSFVCWRPLAENPWIQVPLNAAVHFLPPLPAADPLAPGPFAFADAGRVRSLLLDAGFRSVSIEPFDTRIGGGDIEQTLKLAIRIGPLGSVLRENPQLRDRAADAVREVLTHYATPQGVMMPAAVWIVLART
jgi:SAM-dependent methyltransferase